MILPILTIIDIAYIDSGYCSKSSQVSNISIFMCILYCVFYTDILSA